MQLNQQAYADGMSRRRLTDGSRHKDVLLLPDESITLAILKHLIRGGITKQYVDAAVKFVHC